MTPIRRIGTLIAVSLLIAACGSKRSQNAPIEIRSDTTAQAPVPSNTTPIPDVQDLGDGIRDYGDYQAVIAQNGDTVSDLAARIGLSAAELGAYNGLPPSHVLRSGDELVLPPRPGGYGTQIATGGGSASQVPQSGSPEIVATPLGGGTLAAAGTDAAGSSADGNWSPDLAAQAIARATGIDEEGELAAPPSSADPLPAEPPSPQPLQSPELSQYQTGQQTPSQTAETESEGGTVVATIVPDAPAAETAVQEPAQSVSTTPTASVATTGARFQRPVSGPIAIGYKQGAGGTRNDGVDFAAAPGTPVFAADNAEVALVSESLGGLGTIVLLRHSDGLLTVYGRVTNVTLSKGALVSRGQQIGEVATPPSGGEARMHFEVRRGAESLDPTPFLAG
ncbi:MAG: LysM peptidoglycan-binding domain-containing M23 family metallopeptidase [Pseudomonadota bacterium]